MTSSAGGRDAAPRGPATDAMQFPASQSEEVTKLPKVICIDCFSKKTAVAESRGKVEWEPIICVPLCLHSEITADIGPVVYRFARMLKQYSAMAKGILRKRLVDAGGHLLIYVIC